MKHIKKHPINDKQQQLSKDMKKQEIIKPKKDKKLDADDSLSDPKISKKYTKPSNKKLSGEKHLSKGGIVKSFESFNTVNEIGSHDGGFGPVELTFEATEDYNKAMELFTKLNIGYFVVNEDNRILSIRKYHMKNISTLLENNSIKYKVPSPNMVNQ